MQYEVLTVYTHTDHPAACHMDDEELVIVQELGNPQAWWPADEFFYMVDVLTFSIPDPLEITPDAEVNPICLYSVDEFLAMVDHDT